MTTPNDLFVEPLETGHLKVGINAVEVRKPMQAEEMRDLAARLILCAEKLEGRFPSFYPANDSFKAVRVLQVL